VIDGTTHCLGNAKVTLKVDHNQRFGRVTLLADDLRLNSAGVALDDVLVSSRSFTPASKTTAAVSIAIARYWLTKNDAALS
jgi:hypothetical protein